MTGPQGMGSAPCITVERLCRVAEVSRASSYRHWHETEPRTEETAVRDAIQRLCLANRHYGRERLYRALSRLRALKMVDRRLADCFVHLLNRQRRSIIFEEAE